MTISIGSTHTSTTGHNSASQPSKLGNAFRSLALGTAIGLGTLAPTAAAVAQEKPPENVPVQEQPKQEEPKDKPSCLLDILIAYALGRTFGYFHGKRVGAKSSTGTSDKPEDLIITVEDQPPAEKTDGPAKEEKKS